MPPWNFEDRQINQTDDNSKNTQGFDKKLKYFLSIWVLYALWTCTFSDTSFIKIIIHGLCGCAVEKKLPNRSVSDKVVYLNSTGCIYSHSLAEIVCAAASRTQLLMREDLSPQLSSLKIC